jgi:hypothetical protein
LLGFFQEEGWLMGFKEATGQKGMFPANFTRPMWSGQFFLALVTKTRSDLLRKEEKTKYIHTMQRLNSNFYIKSINAIINQKIILMDGPGLWKKNQEETKIFLQIGLNLLCDLIHWPATTIKTIKMDVGVALPTRPHPFSWRISFTITGPGSIDHLKKKEEQFLWY